VVVSGGNTSTECTVTSSLADQVARGRIDSKEPEEWQLAE